MTLSDPTLRSAILSRFDRAKTSTELLQMVEALVPQLLGTGSDELGPSAVQMAG